MVFCFSTNFRLSRSSPPLAWEDGSGSNREKKHPQIVHMKEVVDNNTKRDNDRKEKVAKAKEILAKTLAIASVQELDTAFQIGRGGAGYLTVAALDLQLDWHIANSVKESSSEETSASGIPKAKSGANGRGNRDNRYGYLKEAIHRRSQILERVAAGLSSMVEETAPEEPSSAQWRLMTGVLTVRQSIMGDRLYFEVDNT
ncbi:hypothetical protein B0H13DRAFT_2349369 [Mycena leptocephala]|nr:hypothetical protein B0H13DRAFT_2349369 [Mycena leptocephala]